MDVLAPTVYTNDLGPIGDELGAGGQATVFKLTNHSGLVYKRYHAGLTISPAALDQLVTFRRSTISDSERQFLDARAAWPISTVREGAAITGVVLPLAPAKFTVRLKSGNEKLRELQFLYMASRSEKLGISLPNLAQRVEILRNFAETLAFFERYNIVHGDISHANILWSDSQDIYVLDCDGASLAYQQPALPRVSTPHWTDPRVTRGDVPYADGASDRYAMGLSVLRCYYRIRGHVAPDAPSFTVPATPKISSELSTAIGRSLSKEHSRPTFGEWSDLLDRSLRELRDPTSGLAIANRREAGPAPALVGAAAGGGGAAAVGTGLPTVAEMLAPFTGTTSDGGAAAVGTGLPTVAQATGKKPPKPGAVAPVPSGSAAGSASASGQTSSQTTISQPSSASPGSGNLRKLITVVAFLIIFLVAVGAGFLASQGSL